MIVASAWYARLPRRNSESLRAWICIGELLSLFGVCRGLLISVRFASVEGDIVDDAHQCLLQWSPGDSRFRASTYEHYFPGIFCIAEGSRWVEVIICHWRFDALISLPCITGPASLGLLPDWARPDISREADSLARLDLRKCSARANKARRAMPPLSRREWWWTRQDAMIRLRHSSLSAMKLIAMTGHTSLASRAMEGALTALI